MWTSRTSSQRCSVTSKDEEGLDHVMVPPTVRHLRLAYYSVMFLRKSFDIASGYTIGKNFSGLDERSVLTRCLFLETVAGRRNCQVGRTERARQCAWQHCSYNMLRSCPTPGVPGFAAAMIRHLHSLRRMQRDHGWIHTLLEEAENERMHLMTFLQLRKPGRHLVGTIVRGAFALSSVLSGPMFRLSVILAQWTFTAFFMTAYLISPRYCHR